MPAREFFAGARDQLPILLGVIPFGLIFGALARSAGVSPLAAQGFSLFVFAGSAQFVSLGMLRAGASPWVIVLTILTVNLRHALYSASMAPFLRRLPTRWKIALAWLLTDEAFVVASARYRKPDIALAHWYTLGTGLTLWASWQASTALGVLLGSGVHEGSLLEFALPLTFIALLIPSLADRPAIVTALSAGVLSVALARLPYRLGLLLAATAAVGIGLAVEARRQKKDEGPKTP